MSTKMKVILGIVVVLVVLIGGCNMMMRKGAEFMTEKMIENASDGKAKVDVKDGSVTITTSEGTVTTGGGSVPEGWPKDVPVYAGAKIEFSGTNTAADGGGMALVMSSSDDAATVVEYYKKTLKAAGWSIGNTMEGQGNTILLLTKGSEAMSLAVTAANGITSITIGMQNQTK